MPAATFDRILAGLYQAAAGLEDWDRQWSRVVDHLGARSSVAWLDRPGDAPEALASPGIETGAFARYLEYYQDKDPYNVDMTDRLLVSEEIIPHGVYLDTEFYRDFVRTLSNRSLYFMGCCLPIADGGALRMGFQREAGLADFDRHDKARLRPLLPHLPGMMSIRSHARALAERSEQGVAVLDAIADALFCVDRDGRVLFRNRAALFLCDRVALVERDGGGRVVLARTAGLPPHWVRAVAAGGPGRDTLLCDDDGPTHGVSLVRLETLPDGIRQPSPGAAGHAVLIRFRALSVRDGLADAVRGLFGLTGAEAAVAVRLSEGDDVPAIAAARGVSVHTVRTQVRMILEKSGTRTLRDFTRIVGRL